MRSFVTALHVSGSGCKSTQDIRAFNGFADGTNAGNCIYDALDFSVDNVGFFKGTPPTDPPMRW